MHTYTNSHSETESGGSPLSLSLPRVSGMEASPRPREPQQRRIDRAYTIYSIDYSTLE